MCATHGGRTGSGGDDDDNTPTHQHDGKGGEDGSGKEGRRGAFRRPESRDRGPSGGGGRCGAHSEAR